MSRRLAGLVCGLLLFALWSPAGAAAQGHVEFGFHYGPWSVNVAKSAIEKVMEDFGEEIKNKEVARIRQYFPHLSEVSFTDQVAFDSSGNNIGFEARWYPGGQNGSFSIGLAGEQTTMKISLPTISTDLTMVDSRSGTMFTFNGLAAAQIETKPLALMLTLRWDILPSHRVSPYISIGGGAAGISALDKTTLNWNYSGTLSSPGFGYVTISDARAQTLAQLKAEENFDYPIGVFPFVQLNLGLKVKVTKSLHLLLDAGVLNGVVFRGGIAFRL